MVIHFSSTAPVDDTLETLDMFGEAIAFAGIVGFYGIVAYVVLEVGGELHAELREVDVAGGVFAVEISFYILDGSDNILEAARL